LESLCLSHILSKGKEDRQPDRMDFIIKNKVAIVTGGSSGIGRALCISLANEGAKAVVVADINAKGAEETLKRIVDVSPLTASQVDFISCDCSREADIVQVINKTTTKFGSVDIFVGNAGIGTKGDFIEDFNEKGFRKQLNVNVMQHIWSSKALVPQWQQNKSPGCIVIVASAAGLLMQIGSLSYAITKRAAVSVAEFIAITYGQNGVSVVCVCPQAVKTPMVIDESGTSQAGVAAVDGMLEPEEVASETVSAIKDGRFLVVLPGTVKKYMNRKADDPERWIKGMQRLNARFLEPKL